MPFATSQERHDEVRKAAVRQLTVCGERYSPHVSGSYHAYLSSMATPGVWGDHVSLQVSRPSCSVLSPLTHTHHTPSSLPPHRLNSHTLRRPGGHTSDTLCDARAGAFSPPDGALLLSSTRPTTTLHAQYRVHHTARVHTHAQKVAVLSSPGAFFGRPETPREALRVPARL